jgi:hypothetical protein
VYYNEAGSKTTTTKGRKKTKKKGKVAEDEPRRPLSAYKIACS